MTRKERAEKHLAAARAEAAPATPRIQAARTRLIAARKAYAKALAPLPGQTGHRHVPGATTTRLIAAIDELKQARREAEADVR